MDTYPLALKHPDAVTFRHPVTRADIGNVRKFVTMEGYGVMRPTGAGEDTRWESTTPTGKVRFHRTRREATNNLIAEHNYGATS